MFKFSEPKYLCTYSTDGHATSFQGPTKFAIINAAIERILCASRASIGLNTIEVEYGGKCDRRPRPRSNESHIPSTALDSTTPHASIIMSSVIRNSFYHSTPVLSRRNRFNAYPFIGEQFSCDVDAWLELDQLASHVADESFNSADDGAEDWWMVELGAAAEYDASRPSNDGKVKAVTRVAMRLGELAARMLTGDVVRGHRIVTTDPHLTRIPTAESVLQSKRKPVTDEMATMATEDMIDPIAQLEAIEEQQKLQKKQSERKATKGIDSDCDPKNKFCPCKKCRELPPMSSSYFYP